MKLLFEIHITCFCSQATQAAQVASALKWKTSEIKRDPVLGNDTYYYLTKYAASLELAHAELRTCVDQLINNKIVVIREKIEHIVHDKRYEL